MLLHFFLSIASQPAPLFFLLMLGAFIFIGVMAHLFDKKAVAFIISFVVIILFIIGMILMRFFKNQLIYNYGEDGTAIVSQIEQTNSFLNYQRIERYNTLLKKADGTKIETYFETWDFNIYPKPEDGWYSYPVEGVEFAVKYMPQDPQQFIILADAKSDYSKAINCSKLQEDWTVLQNKIQFDPDNVNYKQDYAQSLEKYIESDCEENDFLMEHYQKNLAELKQEIESVSN